MTDKANPLIPIKNIPESAWKKLSEKKIYFGHQSSESLKKKYLHSVSLVFSACLVIIFIYIK